ncbi:MAG: nucleoside-triphosphatase [Ignavibacteria bacterium]
MSNVYIFTGDIKTGKTTHLQKWVSDKPDANGILSPVIDGCRHIVSIKSNETRLLEYSGNDKSTELTKIGNYNFLSSVFEWGREELYKAYLQKPEWLIVDEIGPLELRGEGLEPVVSRILNDDANDEINVVLVVRKPLLEKVIEHYGLHTKGYKYFNDEL